MNGIRSTWGSPANRFPFLIARARSGGTPEFHWDSGHVSQGQLARTCREKWHHYRQVSAAISFIYLFIYLSMCIIAVKKCWRNRAFRENWLLASWSLFWVIEMSAGARYRKYGSNYWLLMIVVTEKAVCIRNQLPVEILVLLNLPRPPPVLVNFWNFVRRCLAFAPKVGGSYVEFPAAKSGLALLRSAIKPEPEISGILHLWSSGLAVGCVTEFACHYLILYEPSQGFRTLLFLFDELAIWQAIYLFAVCQCRYNTSNFIIFHKGSYK